MEGPILPENDEVKLWDGRLHGEEDYHFFCPLFYPVSPHMRKLRLAVKQLVHKHWTNN